jgi:integrase
MKWSWAIGTRRRGRVKAYERADKGGMLYMIWSERGQQRQKNLGRHLRTENGKVIKDTERWAKEQARAKHEELRARVAGYTHPSAPNAAARHALTLEQTIVLLQDPIEGKFPQDTPHRREVVRSIRYVRDTWGAKATWASVSKRDLRNLARRRMGELVADGKRGARTAEKMIEHILSVSNWLRDDDQIPEDACRPSSRWTEELYEDWRAISESEQDYRVEKPRHTLDEARAILAMANDVDPRFHLLVSLGADLRLGQVVRARRSQLDLDGNTFVVFGRGKKQGTTIELTSGQRRAVEQALRGYLVHLERECVDYQLFPGRFASEAGEFMNPDGGYLHKQTIYRWFRRCEKLAGIKHVEGRCAYGIRRTAVDALLAEGISLPALQNNGGWSSPAIPTQEYADRASLGARQEAARARASWRGEGSSNAAETV